MLLTAMRSADPFHVLAWATEALDAERCWPVDLQKGGGRQSHGSGVTAGMATSARYEASMRPAAAEECPRATRD
jgi:hypothetical protein